MKPIEVPCEICGEHPAIAPGVGLLDDCRQCRDSGASRTTFGPTEADEVEFERQAARGSCRDLGHDLAGFDCARCGTSVS